MKDRFVLLAIVANVAGCSGNPLPPQEWQKQEAVIEEELQITAEEQAKIDAEAARWEKIENARHADPKLNWLWTGITTGKFSESISSRVYKTYDECQHC